MSSNGSMNPETKLEMQVSLPNNKESSDSEESEEEEQRKERR
jgi:hypothetical protein